ELVDRDRPLGAVGVDEVAVEVGALLRLEVLRARHALERDRPGARDLPRKAFGLLLVDLDLARAAPRGIGRERRYKGCGERASHRPGILAGRGSGRPTHGYDGSPMLSLYRRHRPRSFDQV